jgi:E3 ubiquitin-protein ligase BAH
MKFSHTFEAALRNEEYPQQWLDVAISYRQLKKCIKKVQDELRGLGLDPVTVQRLWQHIDGTGQCPLEGLDPAKQPLGLSISDFRPKLTIAVDPHDGSPIDAWLSPQTRRWLRDLAHERQLERRGSAQSSGEPCAGHHPPEVEATEPENSADELETVEVPLTSYSGFFPVLGREVEDLDRLQISEQRKLRNQVVKLGDRLNDLSASSSSKSTKEIYAWREIFRLYTEAQVFFSSNEQDAGRRDAERASTQLQLFCTALEKQQKKSLKLGKNAKKALDGFMCLNLDLLRFMKYQEINRTAMSKIVKKFDKRTALRAQQSLSPTLAKSPFMVQDLAKATCFTISKELLTVIPQLDDYLCPVCFNISFKPVRLRCNHVFCIRCLIVMQRAREDHCPLCRREVVMEASRCKFSWS